ncbi:major facilitator superfamily protein, putative [Ichthyophthirius multifiliis]|uniref:Major facilitator superfamily protein, putative n=1 Tax=Ichthyophthirius multifiliis TaxID=5932 RepID=G0QW79_ICHMU|nr:major facilitator superfamily protein, putative [Ichthyophthirius multifiliis]EGR30534.1 major facilitator superfamily protein, putative [Ichthyophthirius multifiliis]|eukprot:XP_004032121.1 major facilitator superfamily protein, putative [Ichthyophthirius multifiliis]
MNEIKEKKNENQNKNKNENKNENENENQNEIEIENENENDNDNDNENENENEEQKEEFKQNGHKIEQIYIFFCLAAILSNFATGVIPASLIQMEQELKLTFSQQASIGSLEYLGVCVSTFFVTLTVNKFSLNHVLSLSVFLNGFFSLIIALMSNIYFILLCRFGQGFCTGYICIYGPIWINHYSPKTKIATWLGLMQAFVPLGVMLGYTTAALLINITGWNFSWRLGFASMFLFTSIVALYFLLQDNKNLDILYLEKKGLKKNQNFSNNNYQTESLQESKNLIFHQNQTFTQGFLETLKQYGPILKNNIFIYVCIGLCTLFYIVTGIQYWATEYFIKFCRVSSSQAMFSFSIIAISGPTFGAIIGGKISDKLGGYKGENRITALKYCVSVGLAALLLCIPVGYVFEFWELIVLIWFLLAFGGALIPNGTGICLSCLPKVYHSTCGYFLCPLLSGWIMDRFEDKNQGLVWGWRSVLCVGLITPFFFVTALRNEMKNIENQEFEYIVEKRKKAYTIN